MDLRDQIQRFGHRNWIAVVDAAFPELTSPGIVTMSGEGLRAVIDIVNDMPHLSFEPLLDEEFLALPEETFPELVSLRS